MPCARKGFSLIELSIVLVIIGLVMGGVLIGKDMIKSAQLRKLNSDMEKLEAAVNAFKVKYGYLPGDMPTATQYWGADAGCPATPRNSVPKTVTCDGNNNGLIESSNVTAGWESQRALQQMANAGMIAGKYTGTSYPGASSLTTSLKEGINAPPTPWPKTAYWVATATWAFGSLYSRALVILANRIGTDPFSGSTDVPSGGFLTPMEAFQIDSKLDDGLPYTGIVGQLYLFNFVDALNCIGPSGYNISYTGSACMMGRQGSL